MASGSRDGRPSRPPILRNRSDDYASRPGALKLVAGSLDGSRDQRANGALVERRGVFQTNVADLAATARQKAVGIAKVSAP